jgi:hypothetical protein
MSNRALGKPEFIVRLALTLTALFATGSVLATALPPPPPPPPTLRVAAANSFSNNAVYDVFFSPISTLLLNSDGATYQSFHSLVYVPNALSLGGVDLVAADTASGKIVRYFAPTGMPIGSTVVYTFTNGNCTSETNPNGSMLPDGLSVDGSGNLYVVTNCPSPQLWVLPASSPPATGVLPPATGFATTPTLLNQTFNPTNLPNNVYNPNGQSYNGGLGYSGAVEVDSLAETVVVPPFTISPYNAPQSPLTVTAQNNLINAGIGPGDLLVLTSDNDYDPTDGTEPTLVFDYSAANIKTFLACTSECTLTPTIVLWESQFPYTSNPSTSPLPAGMDIWPIDGSLLISTNMGTILQFTLPNAATSITLPTTFASFPNTSFGKLRTGAQVQQVNPSTGVNYAYAFVTQSTTPGNGNILAFASPTSTPNPLLGFTVPTSASTNTTGSPMGLTVAPPGAAVVASLAGCATGNCGVINPTGGLASTFEGQGAKNLSGEYLQSVCIVVDNRVKADGTCPGNLTISNAQCPNFSPNTNYTLPPTMCGASTSILSQYAGKTVLAAIQTVAPGGAGIANILVDSVPQVNALIPGATNPVCSTSATHPQQVGGWAPTAGEGTQPEGASTIIDNIGYCDNGHSVAGGPSLFVTGTNTSTAITKSKLTLTVYTDAKLALLGDVVVSADINSAVRKQLLAYLAKAGVLLTFGQFAPAADQIAAAFALVYNDPNYLSDFIPTSNYPNPWGTVLARLQNVYYDTNTLLNGQTTGALY